MKFNRHYITSKGLHLNYSIILDIVENNSRVLDLGCGDGTLLKLLKVKKDIKGQGIEINQKEVIKCLSKGLSVVQGNIDEGLKQFRDKSYDYVILNRTLQSVLNPEFVIDEMLRVGKKCIVSFPNFAYWKVRLNYLLKGQMPKSRVLPFEWYNTPNIHLLTIKDFFKYAKSHNFKILEGIYTTKANARKGLQYTMFSNFFAEEGIFVIAR